MRVQTRSAAARAHLQRVQDGRQEVGGLGDGALRLIGLHQIRRAAQRQRPDLLSGGRLGRKWRGQACRSQMSSD